MSHCVALVESEASHEMSLVGPSAALSFASTGLLEPTVALSKSTLLLPFLSAFGVRNSPTGMPEFFLVLGGGVCVSMEAGP